MVINMKIFRLSLFNLRKNRREALAIVFLTLITVFLLGTVAANIAKASTVFEDSFDATGSVNNYLVFRDGKYREEYKEILEDEYVKEEVIKVDLLYAIAAGVINNQNEKIAYNILFFTEENERRIESFVKGNSLSEEEISGLKHPIWLPQYFEITGGFKPGDIFTVVTGGRDYPFEIAGFYETGLGNDNNVGVKCIVTDRDYTLLSSIYEEDVLLGYNSDTSLPDEEFISRCEEESSENITASFWYFDKPILKMSATVYLDMFMYISGGLSLITLVAVFFLIRHKIKNDIEDQMQQIGVLEALGYTSSDISKSYIFEYVITGGIGALLGAVCAVAFTPVMDMFCRIMMNRNVHGNSNIAMIFVTALIMVIVITAFALIKAGTVKKYPPVVAFRRGIKTHHWGRNAFPLEATRSNINLRLALKNTYRNAAQNIGTGACVALATVSMLFCLSTAVFFSDGLSGLLSLMGMEVNDLSVTVLDSVDANEFAEELNSLPEVRKALVTYNFHYLSVQGSVYSGAAQVYDDFNETENIPLYSGRYPEHDNEIAISLFRSRSEGYDIGDSIIVKGDGTQKSFLITGIISGMSNSRMNLYLTDEGYKRVCPNSRPDLVQIYLNEGIDRDEFTAKLASIYGAPVTETEADHDVSGTLEERIRSTADQKIAALMARYGVTDVDYAIKIGDQMITGRSSGLKIKDIGSTLDLAKSQMGSIADATSVFCAGGGIFITLTVAFILSIIATSNVRRQRKDLGIMKSLGYSSKDLMTQLALQVMPATIVSTVIAAVLSVIVEKTFWFALFGVDKATDYAVMIITCVLMVIFCYVVTYLAAGKIKKISVNELMTE